MQMRIKIGLERWKAAGEEWFQFLRLSYNDGSDYQIAEPWMKVTEAGTEWLSYLGGKQRTEFEETGVARQNRR